MEKNDAQSPSLALFDQRLCPTDRGINQLAKDTLSEIFLLCLPPSDTAEYEESLGFISPSDRSFPFTLLLVCKRWRYVALDTSLLWRNIQVPSLGFDLTAFSTKAMSSQLKFLRQWLSFSNVPLSIKLVSPGRKMEYCPAALHASYARAVALDEQCDINLHSWNMLLLTMTEEKRWKALDIWFDAPLFHKFLASSQFMESPCIAANLANLRLSFDGVFAPADISSFEKIHAWIKRLPALQVLALTDYKLPAQTWLLGDLSSLPFGKIPKIEFKRFRMMAKDGAHVLAICASAQDICLEGQNSFSAQEQYTDMMYSRFPRTFANMSRLRLIGIQFPTSLLSRSTFPVLEHLEVYSCMEPSFTPIAAEFSRFLQCSTALKTVIIHSMKMSAHDAFSLLCIGALQLVPWVELRFKICTPGQVKTLMTHMSYQWFREGPDFCVWKSANNYVGNSFGWKLLNGDETLVWELKNGVVHQHSDSHIIKEIEIDFM